MAEANASHTLSRASWLVTQTVVPILIQLKRSRALLTGFRILQGRRHAYVPQI